MRQEYERLWQRLGTRPIEDLIDLPLMNDAGTRATMDVLTKLMPSAQTTDNNLTRLLIARMVNLSLEYGNSNASCVGYVSIGRVLAADFGNYPAALRFGQLSLDLVEKRGLDAFKARVYLRLRDRHQPLAHNTFDLAGRSLLRASDEANKIGDLPYVGYCRLISSRILWSPVNPFTKWNGRQWKASTSRGRLAPVLLLLSYSVSSA